MKNSFFSRFTPISYHLSLMKNNRIKQSIIGKCLGIMLFRQNIRPVFISQQIFIIRRQKMYMPRQFATSPADVMNIPCLLLPLLSCQFRCYQINSLLCIRNRQPRPPDKVLQNSRRVTAEVAPCQTCQRLVFR